MTDLRVDSKEDILNMEELIAGFWFTKSHNGDPSPPLPQQKKSNKENGELLEAVSLRRRWNVVHGWRS